MLLFILSLAMVVDSVPPLPSGSGPPSGAISEAACEFEMAPRKGRGLLERTET